MIKRLLTICALTFASVAAVAAQKTDPAAKSDAHPPSPAFRILPDIPYVTGGTERQRLDLCLPTASTGPARPLIVWVHGGAWEMGDRHNWPGAPFLVARGYIVASLGYRLSQQAVHPAQIEDCKAALRWLRAHASEYNIDPARVGAAGESAGGHLVALLGTTGNTHTFDVGENLTQSSAVQCAIDLFGPTDFMHWGDSPVPAARDTANTAISRLLGGPVSTHQDAARTASPATYVDAHNAPFLIFHGDKDTIVPVQQSRDFDAALRKAGVETMLKVLPGAGHGGPAFVAPENLQLISDFLDKHLVPKVSSP